MAVRTQAALVCLPLGLLYTEALGFPWGMCVFAHVKVSVCVCVRGPGSLQ